MRCLVVADTVRLALMLLTFGSLCEPVRAQTAADAALGSKAQATIGKTAKPIIDDQEARARLARKVKVNLRATTLAAALAALSAQTDLHIEAVPYLREHRLSVLMNDVSAAEALNALGEINDWKWRVAPDGHVTVDRPTPRTPRQIGEVSLALQAAMPKDLRRFLGSEGTLRDVMRHENYGRGQMPPKVSAFQHGDTGGMFALTHQYGRELAALLGLQLREQKPVAWAALTPDQRRLLVRTLVGVGLGRIITEHHNLLTGLLAPYERDPQSADIGLKNGNRMLISTTIIGTTFDGRPTYNSTFTSYRVDAPETGDGVLHFP